MAAFLNNLLIILRVLIPDMEDVVFVPQASAPIPALADLTLLTSLLLALSFCVLRKSYYINVLQLDNMYLAMENHQLIQDLEIAVALGEQQLRGVQELEAVLKADTVQFRAYEEIGGD